MSWGDEVPRLPKKPTGYQRIIAGLTTSSKSYNSSRTDSPTAPTTQFGILVTCVFEGAAIAIVSG